MEHLATVVFERTPAGAVAIKAAGDALPRTLRSLLLAIDGRSPVSQYVPFLTALAPLSDKFVQLETLGFARRRTAPSHNTDKAASAAVTEAELQALARDLCGSRNDMPGSAAPSRNNTNNTTDLAAQLSAYAKEFALENAANDAFGIIDIIDTPSAEATTDPNRPAPTARASRPVLRNLLAEMQAFLSRTAGMEGLPVALMLEQITTLAQLRQELPSYAELLTSYDGSSDEAATHLDTLLAMLDAAQS